jgi:hypothetical protein
MDAKILHGIERLDQSYFSILTPALELLFSGDGLVGSIELLHINQTVDLILTGEASNQAVLVLVRPTADIVGHTDLQQAGTTRHDVDVQYLRPHCHSGPNPATRRFVTLPGKPQTQTNHGAK